ncbi:MAG: hypothetical protein JNK57_03320 [Planctomycetaceae bacterium]|nr:hypothetical protein [Planctomycetaceae bacterium]
MFGSSIGLLAEFNWIQLIVYCGITAALLAIGIYVILMIRDRMAAPDDYETVGDDLESLRRALQFGSIDEAEYRKAVLAVQMQAERLNRRPIEPLTPAVLLDALNGPSRPVFQELTQAEQDTAEQLGFGDQVTETEISRSQPPMSSQEGA